MMTVQYNEGEAQAVVRGSTAVLLPEPVAAEVVARLWESLEGGGHDGVVAVVGALTEAAGSLTGVPPFAVVTTDPGSREARVAVRGTSASVTVRSASGDVEVSGAGVLMWAERVVEDVVAVEVDGPGAARAEESPAWPLEGGVVRAARLVRSVSDTDEPAGVGVPAAATGGTTPPAAPPAPAPSDPDAWPVPGQKRVAAPAGAGDVPVIDAAPSQETLIGGADGAPVPAVAAPAPEQDGAAADEAPGADERPGEGDGTDAQEPGAPSPADADQPEGLPTETVLGGDDDYGHLFGETVFRRVEDAAVRATDEDDEEEPAADVPAPTLPPAPVEPVPAPAEPAPRPAEPSDGLGGLIAGVPQDLAPAGPAAVPAPGTPAPAPAPAPEAAAPGDGPVDDHDGNTIMSSDLAALREAAGAAPQFHAPAPAGAQDVLALACPQGHPNPPTRQQCRTCGAALDGDPRLAPRPALGRVLVASPAAGAGYEDQTVELDRDVVVGRRPRTSTTSAERMPRMVAVPSPQKDISRSHVQVTLEEWHVLVEDLATTNGTVLLRAGQKPRRLHPNQKEIVVDGDVVELGDGVTLTFEGIW